MHFLAPFLGTPTFGYRNESCGLGWLGTSVAARSLRYADHEAIHAQLDSNWSKMLRLWHQASHQLPVIWQIFLRTCRRILEVEWWPGRDAAKHQQRPERCLIIIPHPRKKPKLIAPPTTETGNTWRKQKGKLAEIRKRFREFKHRI